MRILPREQEKVLLHQVGFLAQKRLARGVRLNKTEATALIASVSVMLKCYMDLDWHFAIYCHTLPLLVRSVLMLRRYCKNEFETANTALPILCSSGVHCWDAGMSCPVYLVYSTRSKLRARLRTGAHTSLFSAEAFSYRILLGQSIPCHSARSYRKR